MTTVADTSRRGSPADAPPPPPAASFRERVRDRTGREELLVFRVGEELFGIALRQVEEVVELETVHTIPESDGSSLGVVVLRGRMVPLYSPHAALGVNPAAVTAMLVLRDGARRVGIALDDIDDVLTADLRAVGPAPGGDAGDAGDGVLLAVARRGPDLVGVLDAEHFLASCLAGSRPTETSA